MEQQLLVLGDGPAVPAGLFQGVGQIAAGGGVPGPQSNRPLATLTSRGIWPATPASISQEWDIHGTRRRPAFAPLCCYSLSPCVVNR